MVQTDIANSLKLDLTEVGTIYWRARLTDALQGRKNRFISLFEASSFGKESGHVNYAILVERNAPTVTCHKGNNKSREQLGKFSPNGVGCCTIQCSCSRSNGKTTPKERLLGS
ncbi:uncharacterized protein LOC115731765 [Rhodamnia argentea]|uniref:Uncharacterized protein LOC115731765 n=1 Tax=Rhodamnia argentea TaxID=178133 RepID=A0ABM3H0M1_9MYRT|nr:uncharacterized protein LOC115731765 [Rhodamnia argentea]